MTIDISNVSREKQVFLKANSEFLKNLEEEASKQSRKIETRKDKLKKTKSRWQNKTEKSNSMEKVDLNLRKITLRLLENAVKGEGTLVCPVCGDSDHGNKMNGKPWCVKCNSPLIPKNKVDKWLKLPEIKVLRKSLKDEFKRRGLDF